MPFEKFTGRHRYFVHEPLMTIQRRGTMSLNAAAAEILGKPSLIELYYDTDNKRMALGVASDETPHSYPLRKQDSESYLFSGTAFCQFYGIDFEQTRRYAGHLEDGLLVFDLTKPMATLGRRARNGADAQEAEQ